MFRLWANFPDKLAEATPTRILPFMAVFAIYVVFANVTLPQNTTSFHAQTYFVMLTGLLMQIVGSLILIPGLVRRIRSGKRQLHLAWIQSHTLKDSVYRASYFLSLYFVAVVGFVALSMAVSGATLASNPGFSKSVAAHSLHSNWLGAVMMGLLASTEEVWRWAAISTMLVSLSFTPWWQHRVFRWASFAASLIVSSLLFGWMHVGEYPHYGLQTLLALALSGLLLGLCTLVTRRLVVGMLVHFLYDTLVISNGDIGNDVLIGVLALIILALAGFITTFIRLRYRLNLALVLFQKKSESDGATPKVVVLHQP